MGYIKSTFKVIQSHTRSTILVPMESTYATSCYSLVTTVFSCTVSEIRRVIG